MSVYIRNDGEQRRVDVSVTYNQNVRSVVRQDRVEQERKGELSKDENARTQLGQQLRDIRHHASQRQLL
jgi:hypothetical protein